MSKKFDFFSPEARAERRSARLSKIAGIASAIGSVGHTRSAGSPKLTTQNAGLQAVAMMRDILNNYHLPGMPSLSYSGIRNGRTAANSSALQDGVVTVNASLKSVSGVNISFDIPLEIHEGKLLEPSIIVHNGEPRIIAQSTFDSIVARNTFSTEMPVREQYAAPVEPRAAKDMYSNRIRYTKVNKGMFSASADRDNLRRAMRGQTMVAQAQVDSSDWNDQGEYTGYDGAIPNADSIEVVLNTPEDDYPQAYVKGEFDGKPFGCTVVVITQPGTLVPEDFKIYGERDFVNNSSPLGQFVIDEVIKKLESNSGLVGGASSHEAKSPVSKPKAPKASPMMKAPKAPRPPVVHKNCSRCGHTPCVCSNKKKKTSVYREILAQDLVAKVNQEIDTLKQQGVSDIDIRQAVLQKYGPEVATSVFNKE
jgi:hypothetical protein